MNLKLGQERTGTGTSLLLALGLVGWHRGCITTVKAVMSRNNPRKRAILLQEGQKWGPKLRGNKGYSAKRKEQLVGTDFDT
jgi:hypothetical protein